MVKNRVVQGDELPSKIEELADQICLKINEIEIMEEVLKKSKADKDKWLTELAEILDSAGMKIGSQIILKNGRKMKLKDFFSASIPSKSTIDGCKDPELRDELIHRKEKAFKWLDDNGAGDLVKNQIIAILPKGAGEIAEKISKYLLDLEVGYIREESVHHSTLTAAIKGFLKDGINVPQETFGIVTGVVVEIK